MKTRDLTGIESPLPVLVGSQEERFERHRRRFLGLPFDPDEFNRARSL